MGVNASRVKHVLDTDASVALAAAAAITATATATPVSLNELDLAYWQDGNEIPYGLIAIALNITAADRTTGDETYVFTIQVDDTSDHSNNPVTVATLALVGTYTGTYYVYVDSGNIPKLDPDTSGSDKWIACKATLGGTTPILSYTAVMTKSIKA